MKLLKSLFVLLLVALTFTAAFIGSGVYNVAADDPHWSITHWALDTMRDRSVRVRSTDLEVPALGDEQLIRGGAGNYDSMCATCHLSPGAADTELSLGLYPVPPAWSVLGATDPRDAFWVIKHGIKMSGMPAWGKSMDDAYVWGMVAFLQQLPGMTAEQYKVLVASSPGHSHGGGETGVGADAGHHAQGDAAHTRDSTRSSFEPIDDPTVEHSDDPAPDHDSHDGHPH